MLKASYRPLVLFLFSLLKIKVMIVMMLLMMVMRVMMSNDYDVAK